ncbi:acyltransferase, WS/DGAT/MGAT [Marinobacter daqiaonensis]|uniref:diacylglycerol O-acyltransferase n=1 Tax=Marinobacter daqiaonensis TaxID=650891 RepID=A0A1I6HZD2_9GAMM|nr:WSD1 family O-acyltransferase [Marinobacter daqiaonensis]SFR59811.1 acyltransferase, WS/DGAT/MGAT [Marinobacter daqiaonensis]
MNDADNDRDTLRLLPMDSAWLTLESPQNPLTITVLMRVDGLTLPELRAFLQRYWLAWDRFRMMPVEKSCGWCWQPDRYFDLAHHLVAVNEAMSVERLQKWVSARLNQPLPGGRPRWGFWLVPRAEGGAALLLRIHHCYGDGMSLLDVFDRICTRNPGDIPEHYGCSESRNASRVTDVIQACRDAIRTGFRTTEVEPTQTEKTSGPQWDDTIPESRHPALLEKATMNGLRAINEITGMVTEPEDSASSLKRSLLGRRHCRWSEAVALRRFLSVARRRGCSINDVLLACVTAAMRESLALPARQLNQAVAHAAVPVDIRRSLPASLQRADHGPGNFFGTVFVPLPVDGGFSLERLWRIKHETRRLKRSWQPAIAWGLVGLSSLLPTALRKPISDLFFRKASAVVSNVPGTREPRYLAGHKVTEQMFWVPQAGDIGLGVSIVSYAGNVQFGVVADEAVLDDPDAFLNCCLKELDLLAGD